jgi:hypothetical protein
MQLTRDKCGKAPNGNCKDVVRHIIGQFDSLRKFNLDNNQGFNVNAGAKLFTTLLDQNDGNILIAIGNYNGWSLGMTIVSVFSCSHLGSLI